VPSQAPRHPPGRSTLSGVLAGLGLVAFVDETVFHQLLHWHHFYDRSTPDVGLVSDGLFHAFGFVAVVTGLFLLDNTEIYAAPYHPSVDPATAGKLMSFHHWNFDTLLWVIGLHVFAIFFYRVFKRQKLVGPMISGHKPADIVPQHEAISGSQLWKALIVALVCAGGVYLVLQQAPPVVYEEY
jgi:hypothetical protein